MCSIDTIYLNHKVLKFYMYLVSSYMCEMGEKVTLCPYRAFFGCFLVMCGCLMNSYA